MKRYSLFLNAFFSGLISVALLGPILSFLLNGFHIQFALPRLPIIFAVVFFLRLFFLLAQKYPLKITHLKIKRFTYRPSASVILFCMILGLLIPFVIGKYWLTVLILAMIYMLLGLGLNIVVGYAGLLNLGFVAFYAAGAYTYALLAQYFHLGFWWSLPLCAIVSALFGTLLAFPVLRMYGDYLAIVTLGFAEIVRLILNNWDEVTGGPSGIPVPSPTLFGLEFTRVPELGGIPFHTFFKIEYASYYRYVFLFFIVYLILCATIAFVVRLPQIPLGQSWEALREDEIACRSLGINPVTTKLWAFTLGAMIAGIGGALFAAFSGFISPASFTFFESILILSIVVLGGMGSVVGTLIAAFILTFLPEVLREFSEYRMLLFGGLMVLMMIWRPQGLIQMNRRSIIKIKDGNERL